MPPEDVLERNLSACTWKPFLCMIFLENVVVWRIRKTNAESSYILKMNIYKFFSRLWQPQWELQEEDVDERSWESYGWWDVLFLHEWGRPSYWHLLSHQKKVVFYDSPSSSCKAVCSFSSSSSHPIFVLCFPDPCRNSFPFRVGSLQNLCTNHTFVSFQAG